MSGGQGPPAVLVGALPPEGPASLERLGVPFIWLIDSDDVPPPASAAAVRVVSCPFKSDPLSVLRVPLPAPIRGVVSLTEKGLLPAALLAEALGVATVPLRAVLRTRNKLHMRRALAAAPGDFPQPAFGVVGIGGAGGAGGAAEPAAGDFPVIVKPVEGAGSQGVTYVADAAAYRERAAELTGALWERYVHGAEYSVEAVTAGGRHEILGITAKRTTGPPHFVETGHELPADIPARVAREIRERVVACLDALEVTAGATHTEVVVEAGGRVVVIETHTRAGGDRITELARLVTGIDQCELGVAATLPGVPLPPAGRRPAPRYRFAAVRFLPWQGVTVRRVDGVAECRALPGVEEVVIRVAEGQRVPVWRSSLDRPGHVLVGGDTREELRRRLAAAQAALRPVFTEDDRRAEQPPGQAQGRAQGRAQGQARGEEEGAPR